MIRNFLISSRFYFISNALYYLTQMLSFFYVTSIALPSDIGNVSFIISLTGIFAVIARYGMPTYLIEHMHADGLNLDKGFKIALSFSFSFAIILIPISLISIFFISLESKIYLVYIFSLFSMLIFNPLSMIIQQDIILKKEIISMTIINLFKIIIYPLSILIIYQLSNSFVWALIVANVSLLLSPILVYYFYEREKLTNAIEFIPSHKFLSVIREAFPYFINSLALILIFSVDKLFVANYFSINTLGSYDLMWKIAILVEFLLILPISSILTKDIIRIGISRGPLIFLFLPLCSILLVLILNMFSFNFFIPIWEHFFIQFKFDPMIFKLAISFFIFMFAFNQLRNIMVNLKLKISCIISSLIIVLPILFGGIFLKIDSLILLPQLLVGGVICGMIFNMLSLNYFFYRNNKII